MCLNPCPEPRLEPREESDYDAERECTEADWEIKRRKEELSEHLFDLGRKCMEAQRGQ